MRPLIRRTFCKSCGASFHISGQLSHHARSYLGVNFHSEHKCKYCPMTFERKSRSFKAHEKQCKMFADASRKREDEVALILDSAPQVAVPAPPDVVTLASALTHNSDAPGMPCWPLIPSFCWSRDALLITTLRPPLVPANPQKTRQDCQVKDLNAVVLFPTRLLGSEPTLRLSATLLMRLRTTRPLSRS